MSHKICSKCSETKIITEFINNRNICKNCNNFARRQKYKNNEKLRKKIIQESF